MNKLIELLNEWLKYKEKFWPDKLTRVTWIDNSWELLFKLKNWCYWSVEYVISKRCEFIKRLVDNDKINFDKLEDNSDWYFIDLSDNYLEILALLSIQDNPIEFLISILK